MMNKNILMPIAFVLLLCMTAFVSAETFTSPGTYDIKPGDRISFSGSSTSVWEIALDDYNVSWNQKFNTPWVYFGGSGVGTRIHTGESSGILLNPVAKEAIIGAKINSIDINNKVASVTFIDIKGRGNQGTAIPDTYFSANQNNPTNPNIPNEKNASQTPEQKKESSGLIQSILDWFKRLFGMK